MGIEISGFAEIGAERWISFCDKNPACWVHHKGVAFLKEGSVLSFLVMEEDRIIAICPVVLEERIIDGKSYNIGSLFGLSLPCPVVSDEIGGAQHLKKVKNIIYTHVFTIAQRHNISKIALNLSSYYYKERPNSFISHELAHHGFLDASLKMIILDLNLSEEELWKGLSKGHRTIAKKFINESRCEYINQSNNSLDLGRFSELALKIEDFTSPYLKYLYALYQTGSVDICNLIYGDRIAGSALFLKYGQVVQYHEAERFTQEALPVHHLIVWKSVQRYKGEGYKLMDLGVFSYQPQLNYIGSEKTKAIGIFKRGFGGRVVPFVMGERYFDPQYFEMEYLNRISRYKSTIQRAA